MGQAKTRGTYEERKAKAIERDKIEEEKRMIEVAKRRAENKQSCSESLSRGTIPLLMALSNTFTYTKK